MAQTVAGHCTTASAFGSINASRPARATSCGGYKPDYWGSEFNFSRWPSGFAPEARGHGPRRLDATRFETWFGASPAYRNASLLEVLRTTGTERDEMARLCVAALLNASAGLTPDNVLGVMTARDVWSSYASRGFYEPTGGVRWYAHASEPVGSGGIVAWMLSTMPR